MKQILVLIFFLNSLLCVQAADSNEPVNATRRTCGTIKPSAERSLQFEQIIQPFVTQKNNTSNRINTNYEIPVVVHIVYWEENQNISSAQVYSQFDALNADYAGTGYNIENCPEPFQPLIANTNILFVKATKSPNGTIMAEPGINRVNAQTAGFKDPSGNSWNISYIDSKIKKSVIWDPTKYLNIWVLPLSNSYLGYATFPDDPLNERGVVIGYKYFGTTGTVNYPFNKGRTASHEIGHWLGLYHISGDNVCGDDYCNDTPPQKGNSKDGSGLNYDCPSFPFQIDGCGVGKSPYGEMFMNFMDYTDDVCMCLFTNDQNTRMHASIQNYYTSIIDYGLTAINHNRTQDISISIFPNPSNGNFEINIPSKIAANYYLKIYNLTGQTILEDAILAHQGINTKSINLTGIEKGMYLLNMVSDNATYTQRIIIQ